MTKYRKLKAIISGGGTGGHIFPAVAIADKLRQLNPETDILFVGAEGRMEMEKVPAAGYRIVGLPIAGLQRKLSFSNLMANLKLPFKLMECQNRARTSRYAARRLSALPNEKSPPSSVSFPFPSNSNRNGLAEYMYRPWLLISVGVAWLAD